MVDWIPRYLALHSLLFLPQILFGIIALTVRFYWACWIKFFQHPWCVFFFCRLKITGRVKRTRISSRNFFLFRIFSYYKRNCLFLSWIILRLWNLQRFVFLKAFWKMNDTCTSWLCSFVPQSLYLFLLRFITCLILVQTPTYQARHVSCRIFGFGQTPAFIVRTLEDLLAHLLFCHLMSNFHIFT